MKTLVGTLDFNAALRTAQRTRAIANENTIRLLLQRWISELDPVIAFDRRGDIIGLTFKGGDRVIVSVDDL